VITSTPSMQVTGMRPVLGIMLQSTWWVRNARMYTGNRRRPWHRRWPSNSGGPDIALSRGHLVLLYRLARVEQSAPPRSPGRFWRPLRPFPLRFGQQGAAFPLRHDAGGMGMTATFVVALGVQQRVGVHRQ
jgi:hypothetical protein